MEMLIILLAVVIVFLFVYEITNIRNMRDMGILLTIFGLFFGWPFVAVGAALVIAHYYRENK